MRIRIELTIIFGWYLGENYRNGGEKMMKTPKVLGERKMKAKNQGSWLIYKLGG